MPHRISRLSTAESKEQQIMEVIMAYARLDFSKKASINGKGDLFDAIGAGVNMLGEELKTSVVSLREKEQLLREIHHRVKNNLQIISSLLSLQTYQVQDEAFLTLVRESRNRIKSMALVHEMLYAHAQLSSISFADYISRLSQSVYDSYRRPNMNVRFLRKIEQSVRFDIDHMVPLGLILNEILSNSLKHAFPANKGRISITLERRRNKHYLTVSDNWQGLPPGFQVKKQGSLGMQLIFMLAEQIDGEAKLIRKNGTTYKITF